MPATRRQGRRRKQAPSSPAPVASAAGTSRTESAPTKAEPWRRPVGADHARDPSAGPTPAAGTVVTGPCRFRRGDIADKVRSYESRALA